MCNGNKFYVCEKCGNLVGMINASGVKMKCCGQEMTELVANTVDASKEKHVPVVAIDGDILKVNVGAVDHPMASEHHIAWVYLQTDKGGQRKCLEVGAAPIVEFALHGEKPIAVFAYCNLHGLWKSEV